MAADNEQHPIEVKSSPLARKELSKEEKIKLYTKLRERMSKSKLEVTAPSGWHPYWARKADDEEHSRLDYLGFRIVQEKDRQNRRYKANGFKEDGTYQMGDVILMELPEEEWNFYEQDAINRSMQMAGMAQDSLIEEAEKQGVPTFTVERK